MPVNLDEVRRAFDRTRIAGENDGDANGGDSARRDDADERDRTSVVSIARPAIDPSDGDRTVNPTTAARKSDTGKRARSAPDTARNDTAVAAKSGKRGAVKSDPTSNIERLLFTIHFVIAAKTDFPSLALPQEDAHELAVAVAELNALYGGKGGLLGPKAYAWLNLIVALGGTYLPMTVNAARELKKKRPAKNAATLSTGS